jgi:hypothetical protein
VKETPGSGNQNLVLRLPAVPDLTFSEKAERRTCALLFAGPPKKSAVARLMTC